MFVCINQFSVQLYQLRLFVQGSVIYKRIKRRMVIIYCYIIFFLALLFQYPLYKFQSLIFHRTKLGLMINYPIRIDRHAGKELQSSSILRHFLKHNSHHHEKTYNGDNLTPKYFNNTMYMGNGSVKKIKRSKITLPLQKLNDVHLDSLGEGIISKRLQIKSSPKLSATKRNYNKSLLNILLNYVQKVRNDKSQQKITDCSISISQLRRKYLDNSKFSDSEMQSQRHCQYSYIKNPGYKSYLRRERLKYKQANRSCEKQNMETTMQDRIESNQMTQENRHSSKDKSFGSLVKVGSKEKTEDKTRKRMFKMKVDQSKCKEGHSQKRSCNYFQTNIYLQAIKTKESTFTPWSTQRLTTEQQNLQCQQAEQ